MEVTEHTVASTSSLGTGLPATPARRRGRWSRLGPSVAIPILLCVACSTGQSDSSPRRVTTASTGDASSSQASSRGDSPLHYRGRGYALDLPQGWSATKPLNPKWPTGVRPDHYVAGFTTFTAPDAAGFIAIGSRPIPAHTTLARWQRQVRSAKELDYPECDHVQKAAAATLGGSPASRRWYACSSVQATADVLLTVHGSHGWAVICAVPPRDKSGTHRVCESRLHGFHFRP
jgi:hypothetical protein